MKWVMRIAILISLVLLSIAAFGCPKPSAIRPAVVAPVEKEQGARLDGGNRMEIVSYQQFGDSSEYTPVKAVLVLKDMKTGAEYLCVQGYGVSQMEVTYGGKPPMHGEE